MADITLVMSKTCCKETQALSQLTESLLDSFQQVGGINHIDGIHLPSKKAVANVTQRLLHLLFPGYYDNDPLAGKELHEAILSQLEEVHAMLREEVIKSLDFSPPPEADGASVEELSSEVACRLLSQLPRIRETLSTDVQAAFEGDPASTCYEEIILAYPGLEAIAVHRLSHHLHRMKVALIPRMMSEWAHSRTGIDIHPGAEIGSHFFIDHGTGTVIGETCKIGHHVKIYHGVTLGAKSTSGGQKLRGTKRHPTIEDFVTIYPGVTILGGETVIGEGSTIGGNVSLSSSVAAESLVTYEEHSLIIRSKKSIA